MLKDTDKRDIKRVHIVRLKRGSIFGFIGSISFGIIYYFVFTNYIGSIIGLLLGITLGYFSPKKPSEVYKPFYYDTIIKWVGSPLGVFRVNVLSGSYTSKNRRNNQSANLTYYYTGLGDLVDHDVITEHRLLNYHVKYEFKESNTRIPVSTYAIDLQKADQSKKGRSSTRLVSVFSGFVYRMKLNHPLDYTIRIDVKENINAQPANAADRSTTGNRRLFAFNSAETASMFDCMIYPISASLGKHFDDALKNEDRRVLSPSELQNLFRTPAEQEYTHQKAKELITPGVEKFLIFLRKKYGAFTLVINDHINIQFSTDFAEDDKQKRRLSSLTKLLDPSCKNDNDIMCSSLLRIYESFMLPFLLGKYFDVAWWFESENKGDNAALYGDDKVFFAQFIGLNSKSDAEIDESVSEYYQEICDAHKQVQACCEGKVNQSRGMDSCAPKAPSG